MNEENVDDDDGNDGGDVYGGATEPSKSERERERGRARKTCDTGIVVWRGTVFRVTEIVRIRCCCFFC